MSLSLCGQCPDEKQRAERVFSGRETDKRIKNGRGRALTNTTVITYDALGRKTAMVDPDMGQWTYAYDTAGNLITQTDALSQSVLFAYDPLNRLTGKWYSNGLTSTKVTTYTPGATTCRSLPDATAP